MLLKDFLRKPQKMLDNASLVLYITRRFLANAAIHDAIRHSPFAIRHSPFAIRHSPFAIRFFCSFQ
jgi:hypothetical protein